MISERLEYLIVPWTKSPLPERGRIGAKEYQDWYRSVILAARLLRRHMPSKILLISDVFIKGSPHELQTYLDAFRECGVKRKDIIEIWKAQETTEQVEIALAYAREHRVKIISIVSFFHWPRLLWLCRGCHIEHHIAWGLPRIKEMFTDSILCVAFPLIDLCGGRGWFLKKVKARREAGVQ